MVSELLPRDMKKIIKLEEKNKCKNKNRKSFK